MLDITYTAVVLPVAFAFATLMAHPVGMAFATKAGLLSKTVAAFTPIFFSRTPLTHAG